MNIELVTILVIIGLLVLLSLGLPMAFATGGIAAVFLLHLWGTEVIFLSVARTWDIMGNFALVAVPMFVFMAKALELSGVADELYEAVYHWWGRVRGGLAISTVITCAIMAAMVGIIGAGIVMMGLIALPSMAKRRYNKDVSLGTICAGGCLGILIPPSVLFIIYAMVAGVSIGDLFIGGILPGFLLAALYIIYIGIRCYLRPQDGPAVPREELLSLKGKLVLLKGVILPSILIVSVLGTIFTGIATPTEASGVGSIGALIILATRRQFTWQNLKTISFESTHVTCMLMWVFFGSYFLIGVFTLAGGAAYVEQLIVGLPLGRWGIIIVMQIIMIFMGMFIDWIGILMIAGPMFVPIIVELGFCPLWFGILFNLNMQIGFLSPPFGLALFYLKGVAPPDVTMMDIYRSIWPYIILQMIGLALVMIFPWIGTWLPGLM
ncbi:TRAP transporter large permease subunit [Dehalococcoidia bacterium]|nr:TRAP transporter large permease subunit [Dehalococcoidia bacterium]